MFFGFAIRKKLAQVQRRLQQNQQAGTVAQSRIPLLDSLLATYTTIYKTREVAGSPVRQWHAGRHRGIGRREEVGFVMVDALERIASAGETNPVLL